ncbi:energy-coupled thiamine transporter ThiT [Anoxybacter fermentans]|uniref:Energy-coupled thiamine transporter ThiT n=1 Tax=Anoxybacter fermentans TaxID=1323375 RepID=A0A3S9SXD3_9FIRM|nr:energy-coupled thiamine transporter ThiT [Anoxybacter fermentans]AZR72951.1 energy-coupled thiamine transporter ThiT [Anoxybacter fermentans]
MRNQKIRMMIEMAVAVAIALILNKLVLFHMPQGGSVNLEMLPIIFIALRWGVGAGFLTGAAHGLLQMIFGAYIVHPVQLILDYPLPFALLGLAGLFKTQLDGDKGAINIILGTVIGVFGRFLSHLISGVVFFGEYAPEGQNVWVYSAIYNASYIIPSLLISLVILLLARKQLAKINPVEVSE